ncbi:HypC/HybG/HupF family hydrogenase formation chaperone [Antarcticimicrobium sediminis]|uniref:HypC/HybG/HupF family hydrogenase formation chaperone n=1 Tax=Antarcticimicrobium sediminis TaxID=2546227 RepID=A0A4R5EYV6_9RHOB|nr:HypC/HybG/HupF family hydrogenase formation chaperone [Antarcticimicrobium sediminis]TDE40279.1 HypC/HybG/HupF family hydrogenase formation chaperone [Antarcticimicrobium sediminis]
MCLGIPMQIVAREELAATAFDGVENHLIDLALTGPLEPGTWILTFLGTAREVLPVDEALKIRKALRGIADLMQGHGLGDAFSDLDDRTPQLPPHLQAALDKGETTA